MALASIKAMVEGFRGHQGTINIGVFPFATGTHPAIYLTINPGDNFDTVSKQFTDALNTITRYPQAGNYDASTYPDMGANPANNWLKGQSPNAKDVAYILSDGDPSQRDGTDATAAFNQLKNDNPGVTVNGIGFGEANLMGQGFLTTWGTKEGVYIKSPSELTAALENGIPTESRVGAGSDFIVGGAGQDIIFGDTAIEHGGKQGLEAVRMYIAEQMGIPVNTVTPEIAYNYIKEHPADFDKSFLTGKDDKGNIVQLDSRALKSLFRHFRVVCHASGSSSRKAQTGQ